jgi:cysteinyl-tRNA synthetase
MYVCGSTVYQRIHVGNSRPFVLAMWLRRWLRSRGYEVMLVHNITDVDDKVYEEAAKLGKGSRELAEEATGWFVQDTDDLGLADRLSCGRATIRIIRSSSVDAGGRGLRVEGRRGPRVARIRTTAASGPV